MMGLVTVTPAVSLTSILRRREECTNQDDGCRPHAPGRDTITPKLTRRDSTEAQCYCGWRP
jgi:hypothetical protein